MSEKIRIKFFVSTNIVGSECTGIVEFDREVWEAMTESQREDEIHEAVANYMEWGFHEVDENGRPVDE